MRSFKITARSILSLIFIYAAFASIGQAAVQMDFGASPTSINFGSINVGQSVSKSVTITAKQGINGVLTLSPPLVMSGSPDFFIAQPLGKTKLAGGESTNFAIGFKPSSGSSFSGSVFID